MVTALMMRAFPSRLLIISVLAPVTVILHSAYDSLVRLLDNLAVNFRINKAQESKTSLNTLQIQPKSFV